ncbi:hypothetical protein BSKO_02162 [Bryopsis sp. KO-2023]|nr:hypothetical protein BSKO_02162 [Bryopsis sp. KO-2023]
MMPLFNTPYPLWSLFLLCVGIVLLASAQQETCSFQTGDTFDEAGCSADVSEQELPLQEGFQEIERQLAATKDALSKLSVLIDRQEEKVKQLREKFDGGVVENQKVESPKATPEKTPEPGQNALQQYGATYGKTVARYREAFYDHFTMLAAMKADADVTCIHTMHNSVDGLSRYVVLGDAMGSLSFFSMKGDLVTEHSTGLASAVTAMTSYFIDRNHTALLTGHADGSLRKHIILDKVTRDYPGASLDPVIEEITYLLQLLPRSGGDDSESSQLDIAPSAITNLQSSRADGKRLVFLTDAEGFVSVMWDNGTVKASEKLDHPVQSLRADRSHVVALHENGLFVLSSLTGHSLRRLECAGLNDSTIQSAAFDQKLPTRAYAATKGGDLLTLLIEKNFMSCKVRHRHPIRLPPGPVNVGALKGYIVLSSNLGVAVYNTTLSSRTGPREAILEPHSNIAAGFGQEVQSVSIPHVQTGGENLLVLSLDGGLVGMFESHLPHYKPAEFNTKLWTQPIFIGAMILVGFWQFMKHRTPPTPPISSYNRQYGRERHDGRY